MNNDSLRRVARTFLMAFLGISLPGALGWLNDLTAWATSQGQQPFPDARNLGFLAVAGISAGFIALLNLVWVFIEDQTGKGFLRDVPPVYRGERGESWLGVAVGVLLVLILLVLLLRLI